MTERVKVINHDVTGVLLINAMCQVTKRPDILAMYNPQEGTVDVELKINGHVVPLVAALEDAWKRLVAENDKRVAEKAQELLRSSKADELSDAIDLVLDEALKKVEALIQTRGIVEG